MTYFNVGKLAGKYRNQCIHLHLMKDVNPFNSAYFAYCLKENGVVKQKVFLGVWNEAEHKKWFAKAGKSKQSKK